LHRYASCRTCTWARHSSTDRYQSTHTGSPEKDLRFCLANLALVIGGPVGSRTAKDTYESKKFDAVSLGWLARVGFGSRNVGWGD
jgi:hypothetical protein